MRRERRKLYSREINQVSDEDLMRRYSDGDSVAFDELFRRYEPRAYAFFLQQTRSEDRAQDLYQEVFLRLHRKRTSYDPQRPFAPWFFQIARRLLIDDMRRAFRNREIPGSEQEWTSNGPGPEVCAAQREEAEQLLARLSPIERRAVLWAKVEEGSYAELSQELGKSAGAVKQLASRAMRRLRSSTASESNVRTPSTPVISHGLCPSQKCEN